MSFQVLAQENHLKKFQEAPLRNVTSPVGKLINVESLRVKPESWGPLDRFVKPPGQPLPFLSSTDPPPQVFELMFLKL